ncbi:MAG: membrane protein insertion efficiency factor YidD [Spirochaetaceae bacterium]
MRSFLRLPRYLLLLPIYLYRKTISPALPDSCIYHPSCSAYAYRAVERHGLIRGGILSAARVLRCSSLFTGGEDEVPGEFSFSYLRESYQTFWNSKRRR